MYACGQGNADTLVSKTCSFDNVQCYYRVFVWLIYYSIVVFPLRDVIFLAQFLVYNFQRRREGQVKAPGGSDIQRRVHV
jgi:hypothetical protein